MAPVLGAETYEKMLNRGWRRCRFSLSASSCSDCAGIIALTCRSGRYLYKPDLKNTCCKLYAVNTRFGKG